jgi:hypothetical protein
MVLGILMPRIRTDMVMGMLIITASFTDMVTDMVMVTDMLMVTDTLMVTDMVTHMVMDTLMVTDTVTDMLLPTDMLTGTVTDTVKLIIMGENGVM